MRAFLPVLFAAALAGCATSSTRSESKPGGSLYENVLKTAERMPAMVNKATLQALAAPPTPALARQLEDLGKRCLAMSQQLLENQPAMAAQSPALGERASAIALKLIDSAGEASAAMNAVTNASPAPAPSARPESAAAAPDLAQDAAKDAAQGVAAALQAHRARRIVVTPATVSFGDELPTLKLAFGPRTSETDIYGRAFSRRLAEALARAGLKATFSADVATVLASAPSEPVGDVSEVNVLIYGAVAMDPGRKIAWHLRAVDLNDSAELGEAKGEHAVR